MREAVTGELDVASVLSRRDEVIHDLDDSGQLPWLEQRGIELVRSRGRLDGERRVIAGDDVLAARRAVVVATGSSALLPPIDGLREAQPWTNRQATLASEVPSRLAILGGGVVGVELAQAWSTLGSRVTLIEAADRLIANEEPFASEQVADALHERGVDVQVGAKAVAVRAGDGEVEVELERGGPVRGDELLVAVGRQPNTGELGLETGVSSRGSRSRSTMRCGRCCPRPAATPAPATGSTRSATSTAACCSRTWASTRRGWPAP